MATQNKTPEELAQELQAEKEAAEAAIKEAGNQAGAEAAATGASQEEINNAVEKARKEEKDKLYPQITALKDSIKEIQETLRAEQEEKKRIKEEAEAQAEKRRQEKLSDSERTLEAIRKLEEKLEREQKAREESDRKLELSQRQDRLEKYRATVIAAADGNIIEDIVRGDSEEEIDRTAAIAKARFEELATRFSQAKGDQVRRGLGRTSANPDTAALEEQELSEQLTAVDQDKYLKDPAYRDKIKAELARAYAQAAGRI